MGNYYWVKFLQLGKPTIEVLGGSNLLITNANCPFKLVNYNKWLIFTSF